MSDTNGNKPRILGLNGSVIRPPNDHGGDFVTVDDLKEVVDFFARQTERAQRALSIQQQALIGLEARTLRGRWRTLKAILARWRESARAYLIDLGVLSPVIEVPRSDLDNPKAIPKP